jgi:hypothetical protein
MTLLSHTGCVGCIHGQQVIGLSSTLHTSSTVFTGDKQAKNTLFVAVFSQLANRMVPRHQSALNKPLYPDHPAAFLLLSFLPWPFLSYW